MSSVTLTPATVSRPAVNPWYVATAVVVATFMEILDTTIATASLRYIAGGLSATMNDSDWVMTSYLAANANWRRRGSRSPCRWAAGSSTSRETSWRGSAFAFGCSWQTGTLLMGNSEGVNPRATRPDQGKSPPPETMMGFWGRHGDLAEERLPARCRRTWRA